MEHIWYHTFSSELQQAPEERRILLTEAPFNPAQNREKMAEVLFEKFYVPHMQVCMNAMCALYSTGHTSGLVIDIGEGLCTITPIHEGFAITNAIQKIPFSGQDLTAYMAELLALKGLRTHTSSDFDIVREFKEKVCFVNDEDSESTEKIYELPDGR